MGNLERRTKQGIIIISTLMISVILLILIVALLSSLRGEKSLVLRNNHTTEALFIAEAGISDVVFQLSQDSTWAPTADAPLEVVFPDGNGKYTVVFNEDHSEDAVVGPHESVNNLLGNSELNGPRGSDSVPKRSAEVVVVVELKGRKIPFAVLISRGLSKPVSVPILTSGEILLKGAVKVSGIESLRKPILIPGGIHSNSTANKAGVISWYGEGEDAYISGEVTVSSLHPQAVTADGGEFNTEGVFTGRGTQQFPNINIDLAIQVGREAANLTPTMGGTTTVSGRDYKFAGGTIDGDLVLDGVNLYVDGDLEVNGTIKGTGAIYVKGDTSFRGSAQLKVDDSRNFVLFSKGNVTLEGFDGSQFLDDLAVTDPTVFGKLNEDAKWAHQELQDIAANFDPSNPGPTSWGGVAGGGNRFDQLRHVLGQSGGTPPGRESDTLEKMALYLEANHGGNESADFLIQRLRDVRRIYENNSSLLPPEDIISKYLSGQGSSQGILQILNEYSGGDTLPVVQAAAQGASQVSLQNFDRLGTSYFQGLIYTNGAVYASNEVEIVGALLAKKNIQSFTGEWVVGGETLNAGDVLLTGGSSIIYNKELMENPFAGLTTGPVTVSSWLGGGEVEGRP